MRRWWYDTRKFGFINWVDRVNWSPRRDSFRAQPFASRIRCDARNGSLWISLRCTFYLSTQLTKPIFLVDYNSESNRMTWNYEQDYPSPITTTTYKQRVCSITFEFPLHLRNGRDSKNILARECWWKKIFVNTFDRTVGYSIYTLLNVSY